MTSCQGRQTDTVDCMLSMFYYFSSTGSQSQVEKATAMKEENTPKYILYISQSTAKRPTSSNWRDWRVCLIDNRRGREQRCFKVNNLLLSWKGEHSLHSFYSWSLILGEANSRNRSEGNSVKEKFLIVWFRIKIIIQKVILKFQENALNHQSLSSWVVEHWFNLQIRELKKIPKFPLHWRKSITTKWKVGPFWRNTL